MTKTIVVIDDSSTMRSIIAKHVRLNDADVGEILEAGDGAEAQTVIEANRDRLDLIITDIHMPVCDGIELLEKLKEKGNKIPVVVISTAGDQEMIEKCKLLGVSGFLRKPFSDEEVSVMLKMVFGNRAQG